MTPETENGVGTVSLSPCVPMSWVNQVDNPAYIWWLKCFILNLVKKLNWKQFGTPTSDENLAFFRIMNVILLYTKNELR